MSNNKPIWEGVYDSFQAVPVEGQGFDGETWVTNSLKKVDALRNDAKSNAPVPPSSNYREGLLPLVAALTYQNQKKLSILDFGGGIGFTYYQSIYSLPDSSHVEYHIVEREPVCAAGRKFFGSETENLFFHTDLPDEKDSFDIVHVGSALQYIDEWPLLISRLCGFSPRYLLFVDMLVGNIPSFVTSQNYYNSKIPVWFLNFEKFIQVVAANNYELMFKSAYLPTILSTDHILPMQNFEEKYRLKKTCNLLFVPTQKLGSAD